MRTHGPRARHDGLSQSRAVWRPVSARQLHLRAGLAPCSPRVQYADSQLQGDEHKLSQNWGFADGRRQQLGQRPLHGGVSFHDNYLRDLITYQVTESEASYGLDTSCCNVFAILLEQGGADRQCPGHCKARSRGLRLCARSRPRLEHSRSSSYCYRRPAKGRPDSLSALQAFRSVIH